MFKWAKNSIEAKNDIIHDTTKHLHFENIKIYDSIPLNIRSKGKVMNPVARSATDNDFSSQWPPPKMSLKVELDLYLYLKSKNLLICEMGMITVMQLVTKIVTMTEKLMAMVTMDLQALVTCLPATQFWTF